MGTALVATVAVAALHAVGAKQIHNFAGPWDAWLERADMCNANADDERIQVKFSHYNPNKKFVPQTWSGFANLSREMDDSWWVKAPLAIRSNNQWKENAFVFYFPTKGCSNGRDIAPACLKPFFTKAGTPCLIKQQVIQFQNTTMPMEFPKLPRLVYGYYRLELSAGPKNKKSEYCVNAMVHIIPKV
ncbi:uncharacterized protein LOC113214058 isoform X1 [Frankliniella occidentalis]|uniref:Uncharacterized protein LOC113214058 isoform X1 n=1 Tax=Frankliniella occidentalis TaxID=133901 RepID=A0A6J1T751_FRAOC|nr:uncharacterized protein LOC113214058 isoform X1 [Frankliniella occidentalis]XP_052122303.1 uncharacterized protein LOC113214058 isoform X1 [Frankliniella occidentalis]